MRFNKRAVRKELDLAAEELERHGFSDLANKVDGYNEKLMKLSETDDLQTVRRALARIEREAVRRVSFDEKKEVPKKDLRARAALDRSRRLEGKSSRRDRKLSDRRADSKVKSRSDRLTQLIAARKQRLAKEEFLGDLKARIRKRRLARRLRDRK